MADTYSERDPVEELAEEYLARLRRGENPALSEYAVGHPEHAEAIRELFPTLAKIERLRLGDEEADENHLIDAASGRRIEQLGDFRIIRKLGRGGMGAVYEAEQVSLGRHVALKVLIRRSSRDRQTVERFRREARSAARLHHTNIVPVYEVGQDRGILYYAMQFIEGQGLDRVIDELARFRSGAAFAGSQSGSSPSATSRSGANDREGDAPAPEDRDMSRMVRSLLSGEFTLAGLDTSVTGRSGGTSTLAGDSDNATIAWSASPAGDPRALETAPGSAAIGPAQQPAGALGSRTPNGSALGEPAPPSGFSWPSDRGPYYRSVAHIGRQIAQGLAYAHARGIIHRDVKPSNLLLDGAGVVWITDFGLAKAEEEGLTQTGDIVGTVRYMAPERFRGQGDSRADLYSLGLTLYELLTLRPAFESSDRLELMQQVQGEDPPRPRAVDRHVPLDLETIVLKAIEKEPARRYPHAEAMAEDLRRFYDDEPIHARPVRIWERVAKWARRRPGLAAMALAVQLLLASLLALGIWSYARINQALSVAEDERGRALRALGNETTAREAADLARNQEALTRTASERLSAELALNRGLELASSGQVAHGLRWMARGLVLAPEDEEGHRLRRATRANILAWSHRGIVPRSAVETPERLRSLALSPDGKSVVAGCNDGTVQLYELPSGRPLTRFGAHQTTVDHTEFRPDSRAFLTVGRGDAQVWIWDISRHTHLAGPFRHPGAGASHAQFRPDGRVLFTLGSSTVRLWDANSGQATSGPWEKVAANKAEFSPDGRLLFTFGNTTELQVWDCASGKAHGRPLNFEHMVSGICFLDGGRRFATITLTPLNHGDRAAEQNRLSIFDTATLRPIATATIGTPGLTCVALRPGHPVLAVGTFGGAALFFDSETAQPLGEPLIQDDAISWLRFSLDGRFLLTSTYSGSLRLFDADSGRPLDSVAGTLIDGAIVRPCPDGRTVVTAIDNSMLRQWDIAGASDSGRPLPFAAAVQTAQFSPDGRFLATASFDGTARIFDVATGAPQGLPLEHPPLTRVARFSPDGKLLATGGDDRLVRLWDVATGRQICPPLRHPHWVVNALFSPDGKTLLVGCVEGWARLWDLTTYKLIGTDLSHPSHTGGHELWALAFGSDGRIAITGSLEGTLQFWDVATGRAVGQMLRYQGQIRQLQVLADGKTVLFLVDGQVHSYDLTSHRETQPPFGERQSVMALAADGRTLLTGGSDKTARLWDAKECRPIGPVLEHPHRVVGVAISPDARTLLTIAFNGMVQFWDAATGKPIGPVERHNRFLPVGRIDDRSPVGFHPNGRLAFSAGGATYLWEVPSLADDSSAPPSEFAGQDFDNQDVRRPMERKEWEALGRLAGGMETSRSLMPDDAWHDTLSLQMQAKGSTDGALWHLDRLIAIHPRDWFFYARRSAVYLHRGELDRAATDDAKARELGPHAAVNAWRWHQTFDLFAQQSWREALLFCDEALSPVADQPHPLFLRAVALTHLGRPDDAVEALAHAANRGFRNVKLLTTTKDLEPLRTRDDFKRLLASLQGK